MGGVLLTGTISIGLMLVLGQYYYPDNVVMWLASADAAIIVWRQAIVAGLLALAITRDYYDNLFLRIIWLAAAGVLVWSGVEYGLNNGDSVLDALLMLSAGACFAIAALQPAAEPIARPEWSRQLSPVLLLSKLERHWLPHEQLVQLHQIGHIRDDSHNLTLHSH